MALIPSPLWPTALILSPPWRTTHAPHPRAAALCGVSVRAQVRWLDPLWEMLCRVALEGVAVNREAFLQ
eukprot:2858714-Prymnesium_polylepis.1